MKNLVIIIAVLVTLVSCKQNERLTFEGDSKIYFNRVSTDTLAFALLAREDGSEYDIPVKISGNKLSVERKYKIEVVADQTTATEGLNYKMEREFVFPANVFSTEFKIKLFKTDPELAKASKFLVLRLVPSDLDIAFSDRMTIVISMNTTLRTPTGTGYYGDMRAFTSYFGPYSRKKHELIIEIVGHDFWDGGYGEYGGLEGLYYEEDYYAPHARVLYNYLIDNMVLDENGVQIKPW